MKLTKNCLMAAGAALALAASFPLSAQSEDDMFAGASPLVNDGTSAKADTVDGLLKTDAIKIGGSFALEAGARGNPEDWKEGMNADSIAVPFTSSSVNLFADARPAEDYRFYAKGKMNYTPALTTFELREAFADIQPLEGLSVRAGKQTANWGVGYFFSPGNLLDLQAINPEDPTAERTGPLAVRLQKSAKTDNYYAYFLLEDASNGGAVGIAPKAEWLLGSAEVSLGGLWENDKPWAATTSVTFPLSSLDFFAEATVRGNEDKVFIIENSLSPIGVTTETRSARVFPFATGGFSWSKTDDQNRGDISLRAQYYYNGEGYLDPSLLQDKSASVGLLLAQKKISIDDLRERGQHYGAAMLSVSNILNSDAGVTFFWLGSLSDGSGKTSVTASWDRLTHVRMSLAYEYTYGEKGSEYAFNGPVPSVTLKVSLTQGTF